jgi:cytochrome c peroxidase
MRKVTQTILLAVTIIAVLLGCSKTDSLSTTTTTSPTTGIVPETAKTVDPYANIKIAFGTNIDLTSLFNYANQNKPNYIQKDNGTANPITDAKSTLGRVLFYDKNLSIDNTISCSSCHNQKFAFGDTSVQSDGVQSGLTVRHAMRLVNSRFGEENKFFWNERAASLEIQTTMPIQDHAEMGFSGLNGRGTMTTLLAKLSGIGYYKELFKYAYGDTIVTENRLQTSLAQFIRSIQSFDSKYDIGRAQVNNNNANFPNFTAVENTGKTLFSTPPVFDGNSVRISGGLGCNGCHRAPEFDIDSNSRNNGIIGTIGSTALDIANTRSASLRDLINPSGAANAPMMHTGQFKTIQEVLAHYNNISNVRNTNLDPKLRPNNIGQKLNMNTDEITAITAFMKTLTGSAVYTDKRWSDPFIK